MINPLSGALTAVGGSPFADAGGTGPGSVAVDPSGKFAYVVNFFPGATFPDTKSTRPPGRLHLSPAHLSLLGSIYRISWRLTRAGSSSTRWVSTPIPSRGSGSTRSAGRSRLLPVSPYLQVQGRSRWSLRRRGKRLRGRRGRKLGHGD
jgi:hypothetical protein